MPTPVSAARQYLTDESARALDEAVIVARRRSHTQTTSLHAVSALLALPSTGLREACARARSSAYSPRLQFRALDLCVSVSLDRLPCSSKNLDNDKEKENEAPPISNSLMAAIKRSQANQRRQPDNFNFNFQQQQTTTTTMPSVLKVELKHLILSILDDPIVSRVFGEAGFRSCDIKLAILQPPPPLSTRTRYPPIFLCNLEDPAGRTGLGLSVEGDANSRRVGEILVRKTGGGGKNPLLVGVCAHEALTDFKHCVEGRKRGVLPCEIDGLSVICIGKEVSEFVEKNESEEEIGLKFKEWEELIVKKSSGGPGVVLSFGDLKGLDSENASSASGSDAVVRFLVSQFTKMLKLFGDKLWLMGAAESYEIYAKFLAEFPSIQKDWDLHLLPITSSKPSSEGLASKSSLMGSFVPFGGFFSTPSEFKVSLSITNQSTTRCHLCNERYEQEVSIILKGGCNVSIADQYSSRLPSWLQTSEPDPIRELTSGKAKYEGTVFTSRIMELQKKWNDTCQRIHHTYQTHMQDVSNTKTQFLRNESSQFINDKKDSSSRDSSRCGSECTNLSPSLSTAAQKVCSPEQNVPTSTTFGKANGNFHFEQPTIAPTNQQLQIERSVFPPNPVCKLNLDQDHMSSSPVTKVTTDLGLGTLYSSTSQAKKPSFQDHAEHRQKFSVSVSTEFGVASESVNTCKQFAIFSSCSSPQLRKQLDPRDFKLLWRALLEKVGRQDEVIHTISQTVSRCKTVNETSRCSNIWLALLGPDKVGKKKIAAALAEIMFGNRDNLIYIDLALQVGINQSNSIFGCQELNDIEFRGKTIVDYIAGELIKRPHSVVFLENVDKADLRAQNSLSRAIRNSKFPDSHGREFSINNMIFIAASTASKGYEHLSSEKETEYSEEKITAARFWKMQLLVGHVAEDTSQCRGRNVSIIPPIGTSNLGPVNKRKFFDTMDASDLDASSHAKKISKSCLDLNMPIEDLEDVEYINCKEDTISENSEAWLEDLYHQMDEKMVLKPFEFDALAEKILTKISSTHQENFGSEILLQIDHLVMVQILAAAWLSDKKGAVEDWVKVVLGRSFAEARQRYELTSQSCVKLVICEGLVMEDQTPGICLPSTIILN